MEGLHQGIVIVGIFSFLMMFFMIVTTAINLERMHRQLSCKNLSPSKMTERKTNYSDGNVFNSYYIWTKYHVDHLVKRNK